MSGGRGSAGSSAGGSAGARASGRVPWRHSTIMHELREFFHTRGVILGPEFGPEVTTRV
jgi:hypothetical protein